MGNLYELVHSKYLKYTYTQLYLYSIGMHIIFIYAASPPGSAENHILSYL